jgi:hypothetical protein
MQTDTKLGENIEIGTYRTAHSYSRPLYFGETTILVRIVSKSY